MRTAASEPRGRDARRVADAVYGTILVVAVVAALSEDHGASPGEILGGALATSIVFWIVHVYAEVLSRGTEGDPAPFWTLVRISASQEWPLVEAALAPCLPLLLGAIGVLGRSASITLSIIIGLAGLVGWGYAAGRAMKQSRLASLATAAGALILGVVMVLLKNLVH
ncbi:MAG TPA: hypothetical protein VH817_04950 [Thermoleophilaceae bacterium]